MKKLFVIFFLWIGFNNLFAQVDVKKPAPKFGVDLWVQGDKKDLDIEDFKGKVLYIYGFQAWCPGCHSHGFPTLQKLSEHYKNDKDVAFVAIQTVFEGYSHNTIEAAKKIIKDYKLTMPVGHSGMDGFRSKFMQNYTTGGTPWTIIVDRDGNIRFSNFHLKVDQAISMIEYLKKEK
jgi:thiol-disulfide isomerase/thioredoxin